MNELFEGIDGVELSNDQQEKLIANVDKMYIAKLDAAKPVIEKAAKVGMFDQAALDGMIGNRIGQLKQKVEGITGIKNFDELKDYADNYAKNDDQLVKNFDILKGEYDELVKANSTLNNNNNANAQRLSLFKAGVGVDHIDDLQLLANARVNEEHDFAATVEKMSKDDKYKNMFAAKVNGINAGGLGDNIDKNSKTKTITGWSVQDENKIREQQGLPLVK